MAESKRDMFRRQHAAAGRTTWFLQGSPVTFDQWFDEFFTDAQIPTNTEAVAAVVERERARIGTQLEADLAEIEASRSHLTPQERLQQTIDYIETVQGPGAADVLRQPPQPGGPATLPPKSGPPPQRGGQPTPIAPIIPTTKEDKMSNPYIGNTANIKLPGLSKALPTGLGAASQDGSPRRYPRGLAKGRRSPGHNDARSFSRRRDSRTDQLGI